jgi:4-aminobutyrate aminotransferase-like enzyme
VESVPINDEAGFAEALRRWNTPPYKTAGFCHEIILMNYGGILLTPEFLHGAYKLCRETDTPCSATRFSPARGTKVCSSTGARLKPDFLSVGKDFPTATIPRAACCSPARFDCLSQSARS